MRYPGRCVEQYSAPILCIVLFVVFVSICLVLIREMFVLKIQM